MHEGVWQMSEATLTGRERMERDVAQNEALLERYAVGRAAELRADDERRLREYQEQRAAFTAQARVKPPHLFPPFGGWEEMQSLGLDAFHFYVGPEPEGRTDSRIYLRQGERGVEVWLPEALKASPYVTFGGADALPIPQKEYACRFLLGDCGSRVRVCADRLTGLLHYVLPDHDEALKFVVWFKWQTPEEWMEANPQYEYDTLHDCDFNHPRATVIEMSQARGWEVFCAPESATLYLRRPKA